MEGGVAIAVIGVGALVAVFVITKKQEAQTATMATNIVNAKNSAGLSPGDVAKAGVVAVASYYGGPAGGTAAAKATGFRL